MRKTKTRGVKSLGNGRYQVKIWYTDPKTGAQARAERIIEASSTNDADEKREALRRDLASGGRTKAERQKLGPAVKSWLASKLPAWKASTRRNHVSILDEHVLPAFADFFVDAIEPDDVVRWRDAMKAAPDTVNSRLRLMRQVLADICAPLGIANPAERVPSVRRPLNDARAVYYLDAGEARAVLKHVRVKAPQWYPLVATLAMTGLRFGEATALRWSDLDGSLIRVRRAQWKGVVDHPKSKVGARDIPLLPELEAILRDHRREQIKRQQEGMETGYVFLSTRGTLHDNSVLSKPVKAALKACGITGRFPTAHGWRKFYNDALRRVADETVRQALVGHADAETGRKHYSRASEDEMRAASAKVVRLVTGGGQ